MERLSDKSDRILQKAPRRLIITINITSLSSHRPFFRRPPRLAGFIVMTALFFSHRRWMKHGGLPEVTQQDGFPTRSFSGLPRESMMLLNIARQQPTKICQWTLQRSF
jgi:hypothetical protein